MKSKLTSSTKSLASSALLILSALCVSLAAYSQSYGGVYKYTNKDGAVVFTDRPTHKGFVQLERSWKGWVEIRSYSNYKVNKTRFLPYISEAADRYTLPENLIRAVIHAESYYNPIAVSRAGAVGLMQLMPATALRYGVYNRENPRQNINGGSRYLRDLIKLFDNDLQLALAAYNAGENAVKRYGYKIPPYPETQNYVSKVLKLYRKYDVGKI